MSPQLSARIRATAGLVLAGLISSVAFHACEGSGTQTTTGKGVEGSLVDHQGRPIDGATIKALPIHYGANRIVDAEDSSGVISVTTDANGRYFIANLEVGIYNLIGIDADRKRAVLIPKVKYVEQALDLGADTLRSVGALLGQVQFSGGGIYRAFCFLAGSNFAAITDSAGHFNLSGLPEGLYKLNYYAEGFEYAHDSVIIRAGDTSTLPPKILKRDLALQPPAPQNVKAIYDSVWGKVYLTWDSVSVADFKEYVIEFQDEPQIANAYNHARTTANANFVDEFWELFAYDRFTEAFHRRYWVRARDWEGNLSPKQQPITVRITDRTIATTRFSTLAMVDTAGGSDCADTLGIALDMQFSPDSLVEVNWYLQNQIANGDNPLSWGGFRAIGQSVGSPRRDTLFFTSQDLIVNNLGGSTAGIGQARVITQITDGGFLVHADVITLTPDTADCIRASLPMRQSNGKPLAY